MLRKTPQKTLHREPQSTHRDTQRENYGDKNHPVVYREIKLECGYRIDLLVENAVVVELKQ